jgi:hypothetical protein
MPIVEGKMESSDIINFPSNINILIFPMEMGLIKANLDFVSLLE